MIIGIKYLILVWLSFTSKNKRQNFNVKKISSIKAKIFLLIFFLLLVLVFGLMLLLILLISILIFFSLSSLLLELKLVFKILEPELPNDSLLLELLFKFKFKFIILILLSASLFNLFKLSAIEIHNNSLKTESFMKNDLILLITTFLNAFSEEFNSVFQKLTAHLRIS